jgi:hypothetical protein
VCDLAVLFLHLLANVARLAGPGGTRSGGGRIRTGQAPAADLSIVFENGRPISVPLIAWSPACVLPSCARAG